VFADLQSMPCVARGRARAVAEEDAWRVPPTCVEGAPVGRSGLAGIHVVAARKNGGNARIVSETGRVYGRVVETTSARLAGLADVGRAAAGRLATGPTEEAGAAIEGADRLLGREGFSFRDVARTWFFLRDILDWYGPFNAVRNAAFRRMGLMGPNGHGAIPASTGIAGRNARGGWCTLDLLAAQPRPGGRFEMRRLHGRRQNEATEYGSAFARGMALTLGEWRYVLVSGTASIDDHGATVHVGDFERQTRQTLDAVASVLEEGGASLADLDQGTAFLKNPCDGRAFDRIAERSGLDAAPLLTVEADVCRDDLLFEIDATAVVPLKRGGAKKR
jgi:enamine deaminase RidA (YjgF/YER057c/UK114 family)